MVLHLMLAWAAHSKTTGAQPPTTPSSKRPRTTNATEYVGNPFIPIKFAAIGLGVLNVVAAQSLPAWRRRDVEPQAANEARALKILGGTSLACWVTAVAAGRMIGYW